MKYGLRFAPRRERIAEPGHRLARRAVLFDGPLFHRPGHHVPDVLLLAGLELQPLTADVGQDAVRADRHQVVAHPGGEALQLEPSVLAGSRFRLRQVADTGRVRFIDLLHKPEPDVRQRLAVRIDQPAGDRRPGPELHLDTLLLWAAHAGGPASFLSRCRKRTIRGFFGSTPTTSKSAPASGLFSQAPNARGADFSPRAMVPASGFPSGPRTRPLTLGPASRPTSTSAAWASALGSTGTSMWKLVGWQKCGRVLMNGPCIRSLNWSRPTATGKRSSMDRTATRPGPGGTTISCRAACVCRRRLSDTVNPLISFRAGLSGKVKYSTIAVTGAFVALSITWTVSVTPRVSSKSTGAGFAPGGTGTSRNWGRYGWPSGGAARRTLPRPRGSPCSTNFPSRSAVA